MIDYHCFCQIKALHEQQGLNVAQIAHALSLDARTVASWLRQERFRLRKGTPRASKLAPFKPKPRPAAAQEIKLPKVEAPQLVNAAPPSDPK